MNFKLKVQGSPGKSHKYPKGQLSRPSIKDHVNRQGGGGRGGYRISERGGGGGVRVTVKY